jgi:hypothetical protein
MTKTVHDLRNDIRGATGRHERIESTSFTKEALVAVCQHLDADIDTTTTPPKPEMRAAVLDAVGVDGDAENPFRKAELRAIADALGVE